ncbi:MAG: SemiSWEET family sugar transporter [Planctomycetota bacterium]|jgi:MtN3 and saliva related transmembrane protein
MEWKIVGIIAAIGTTSGFIPQLLRGIRTKKLEDVSPIMYMFLIFGFIMWLFYGIHLGDVIIIGANAVALSFSVFILILRYKYLKQQRKVY